MCLKPDGRDYLKVIEKSLVTIRDSQGTPKTFIITNVKSFMIQAVFYICYDAIGELFNAREHP